MPDDAVEIVEIPIEEGILRPLLGPGDANLHYLQKQVETRITARREKILLRGPQGENERVVDLLRELVGVTQRKGTLSPVDIDTVLRLQGRHTVSKETHSGGGSVILKVHDRTIRARTRGQEAYLKAILKHDITFAVGPAGTGKTFIAVAVAVSEFQAGRYDRIILVRPVVEAGENLGFLPGDIREKVDPYFRPLYDALFRMMPSDRIRKLMDRSVIEIAPLAFMRGRTLDHAFVILDEAQNTTIGQMKMFLTRLGNQSKAVITGDTTQIDLPLRTDSGMVSINEILGNVDGLSFVELNRNDVVRHPLVARIIDAYEEFHQRQNNQEVDNQQPDEPEIGDE